MLNTVMMGSCQKIIWLVDDDVEDQFLVQRAFSSVKPRVIVETLNDGDEVIPALTSSELLPRLIILDLNMARMDGFETLTSLRKLPLFASIPVIVLTTSNNPKDQELSVQMGAADFYTKPFNYQGLLELANMLATRWLS